MPSNPGPVCVVGAGIIGASAALHLIELGARDVTVIDAGSPLSGTTPAGAGFVARYGADSNRRIGTHAVPLEEYGLSFYRGLHDAGVEIEFAANGNIAIARTETTLTTLVEGIVRHSLASPGTRALDADEVASMTFGAVDPASVVGGVLLPEAIQVTTGLALQEVLRRAEALGVRFSWGTEATGIRRDGDRVTGVETTAGVVDAATVVLAAGAWTPALLGTVGRTLPLIPTVATRFVSEQAGLSPLMPTIQSLDLGLWLRELRGAFSWGGGFAYRRVSVLEREEGLERAFARPVSPQLIEAQRDYQAAVAEVFPALAGLGTAEIIQGMPVYSVDGGLYIGPVPACDGLWVLAGDNESGVTHGPGMGRLVAEMITGTEPFADPEPFRLDRVDPALYPDEASMIAEMAGDRVLKAMR
ncbi:MULTISPECIES: FAD-binding oxidoreductase [unclassified Rathayibacter]|uniref:NAD(P)/FAD-dependent oxidoreductase n=1 Tax=unclassified Rathayibacter TaxID=2609250 RepID=UPI000CE8D275|nr:MULTISPECIES: FAD-binding oxidoreductase [unclassified Rathayibacter]PPI41646.1 FAD-dependent oxidoreductase [Rathayibacter sp. RFBD1]PPI51080.1 FAD-dependent oxidoreductase [Rathayibacter sp. TRS19]